MKPSVRNMISSSKVYKESAPIYPPFYNINNENLLSKVIRKISEDLKGDKPTRVILMLPVFEGEQGQYYEDQARQAKFLKIVSFPKGTFPLLVPDHFETVHDFKTSFVRGSQSLPCS